MEHRPLPITTPEAVGIPSAAIHDFLNHLESKRLCMHSFLVIRHGQIAAEGYWHPFHADRKHRMYSCTKSFVSVAIGLLEGEGRLSLDDKVADFFPDKLPTEGVHPYIGAATIRDLLMMASPHERTTYKRMQDDDWVRTFFRVPPSHHPGAIFAYDTSATLTLTAIVEQLSGMSLLDYMRPRVLDPIGFSKDAYCLKTPLGVSQGGSALICTTRDLAKFALLCMNLGKDQGNQLIPESFMRAATARQIDTTNQNNAYIEDQQGYGYQFWRCRNNGFALRGMGGQLAICLPDEELLLVTTADLQPNPDGQQVIFDALWETIHSRMSFASLEPDAEAVNSLKQRTANLSILLPEGKPSSPLTAKVNGSVYQMDPNPMKIKQWSVQLNGDTGTLQFDNHIGTHTLQFGFGAAVAQPFPMYDYDSVSAAAWVDSETLLIYSYIIDDYVGTLRTTVHFKEDAVTIVMRKYAELFLDEFSGIASGKKLRESCQTES